MFFCFSKNRLQEEEDPFFPCHGARLHSRKKWVLNNQLGKALRKAWRWAQQLGSDGLSEQIETLISVVMWLYTRYRYRVEVNFFSLFLV